MAEQVEGRTVQELLGHATLSMTMRYAHIAPAARREAVRLLDRDSRGVTTDRGKSKSGS